MESDLGEMVFAAEKISKKRLRKGKGKPLIFCFEIDISSKDRDFYFLHFFLSYSIMHYVVAKGKKWAQFVKQKL